MLRLLLEHSNFAIYIHEMLVAFHYRVSGLSVRGLHLLVSLKHKMRADLWDTFMQLFIIIMRPIWLLGFDIFTKVRSSPDLVINVFLMIQIVLNEFHGIIVVIIIFISRVSPSDTLLRTLLPSASTGCEHMIIVSLWSVIHFARALSGAGHPTNARRRWLRSTTMASHAVNNHLGSCAISSPRLFAFRFVISIIILGGTCL